MEDLFKQFRDNLERRPEPAFEERDWLDMQTRLERERRKRPAGLVWWWMLAPALLLLAGSNAFFFIQWKKAEQRASTPGIIHDTLIYSRVVFRTDTIYRSRVRWEQTITSPGRLALTDLPQDFGHSAQARIWDNPQYQQKDSSSGVQQESPVEGASEKQKENSSVPALTDTPVEDCTKTEIQGIVRNTFMFPAGEIHPLEFQCKDFSLNTVALEMPHKKKKWNPFNQLYAARPKAFQLGLSSGLAYPFKSRVDFTPGNVSGLQAAVEFSPRLRLWADAAYYKIRFLTERMGEDIGVPIEGPPSNEYLFLQAEVPQPYFQYSAGMQYLFRTRHRLKPFLGIGLGAISLLPYDVTYEFLNTNLGVEWNLDKTVHRQGLITNFWVLPVGLEYGFSKHWNAQFQVTYRSNWKGNGVQSPDMLGIQGGFNYRF